MRQNANRVNLLSSSPELILLFLFNSFSPPTYLLQQEGLHLFCTSLLTTIQTSNFPVLHQFLIPYGDCLSGPCQYDLLVSADCVWFMSFEFAVLMITVFRGCLALSICPRFLWKFLTLSQHLSNSHVDAGGLQVLGTHLPILLRAVLND